MRSKLLLWQWLLPSPARRTCDQHGPQRRAMGRIRLSRMGARRRDRIVGQCVDVPARQSRRPRHHCTDRLHYGNCAYASLICACDPYSRRSRPTYGYVAPGYSLCTGLTVMHRPTAEAPADQGRVTVPRRYYRPTTPRTELSGL